MAGRSCTNQFYVTIDGMRQKPKSNCCAEHSLWVVAHRHHTTLSPTPPKTGDNTRVSHQPFAVVVSSHPKGRPPAPGGYKSDASWPSPTTDTSKRNGQAVSGSGYNKKCLILGQFGSISFRLTIAPSNSWKLFKYF